MGQIRPIRGQHTAPTFSHAAETYLLAHTAPGAWSPGTAIKYRQTLTALAARLAGSPTGRDISTLDTPAGAATLTEAFTAAVGALAPATRLRHLSTLRSALAWWRDPGTWITTDPTAS